MSSKAAKSHETSHGSGHGGGHGSHASVVRTYMLVFATLAVLTIMTVSTAYLNLPYTTAVMVAVIIAVTKISLIAMYFMHMKGEHPLINWSMAVAVLAVFFLIMMVMPDVGLGPLSGIPGPAGSETAGHGTHGAAGHGGAAGAH